MGHLKKHKSACTFQNLQQRQKSELSSNPWIPMKINAHISHSFSLEFRSETEWWHCTEQSGKSQDSVKHRRKTKRKMGIYWWESYNVGHKHMAIGQAMLRSGTESHVNGTVERDGWIPICPSQILWMFDRLFKNWLIACAPQLSPTSRSLRFPRTLLLQ